MQSPDDQLGDPNPIAKMPRTNDTRRIFDLSDRVAVVTGATGVLGSTLAIGLARAGAKVGILGRRSEAAEATVFNASHFKPTPARRVVFIACGAKVRGG